MAKKKKLNEEVEETVDTTEEEDTTVEVPEATEKLVATEEPVEASREPVVKESTKKEDKYADSKKKDSEASFDVVKGILSDTTLTVDEKLEKISASTHVSYKSIVETFKEFDAATKNGNYVYNPAKYGQLVKSLYDVLRGILEEKDTYVSMLKIEILNLLYRKYKDSSLMVTSVFAYGDDFNGTEEEYQDFCYIITTLGIFDECRERGTVKAIPKLVDFKRTDFLHGKRLEEYYLNVML